MRYLSLFVLAALVSLANNFKLFWLLAQRGRMLAVGCAVLTALTLPTLAQTCAPAPPDMVAWWPLNETGGAAVADALGQIPGTASATIGPSSNPKSVPGFVGNGLNFFFGSRVSVTNPKLDFGTNQSFTIDTWIKGHASPIVGNFKSSNKTGYSVVFDGSKLRLEIGSKTLNGKPITPGTWTFVAVVVDRTTNKVTLYNAPAVPTNSSLASSGPLAIPASTNATSGLPLNIGGCPGNPNGCDTIIDEVEIYNRALTQLELQRIVNAGSAGKCKNMQSCLAPPSGMIAWWPFDGSPNDIVGNNNPSSITGVSYQQGQALQGVTFSQAPPGGIQIPEGTLTPQKFTVDAWVKVTGPSPDPDPPQNDPHGSYIVAKPWNANWPTIALTWSAYTYRFRFDFGSAVSPLPVSQRFIDSAAFNPVGPPNYGPDGQFHHVAGTYDGKTYRLYVDGDLKGSVDDATPVNYNGIPWTIGTNFVPAAGPDYRTFNGVIDEVEIFNRALDQSEIKMIYDAGSAGKCKQKKGMTWIHSKSDAQTGMITVGCSGCDAYHGDTVCAELRPLLCIYKPTPPFKLPPGGNIDLWSGGVVATTEPVAGMDITAANSYCHDKFGDGWRAAEFHDGGIWNFQAYGGTVSAPTVPSTHFWVYINDQPDANCK